MYELLLDHSGLFSVEYARVAQAQSTGIGYPSGLTMRAALSRMTTGYQINLVHPHDCDLPTNGFGLASLSGAILVATNIDHGTRA